MFVSICMYWDHFGASFRIFLSLTVILQLFLVVKTEFALHFRKALRQAPVGQQLIGTVSSAQEDTNGCC